MSQVTTWGVHLSGPVSPGDYSSRLQETLDAILSTHSGLARPLYAVAGTIWSKEVYGSMHALYYFDGTVDILIGTLNLSTGVFSAQVANATSTPTAGQIVRYDSTGRLKSGAAPSALTDVVRLDDFPGDTLHFLSNGIHAREAYNNWNDYTNTGFYTAGVITNAPTAIAGSHARIYVTVIRFASTYAVQIARDVSNCAVWQRTLFDGTWGDWAIIWSKPITVALGGNFTSNISLARNGSVVTASWGILYHSLTFHPSSTAGVIPSLYRPAAAKTLLQRLMGVDFSTLNFASTGTLSIHHRDHTSSSVSTTQAEGGGISWIV